MRRPRRPLTMPAISPTFEPELVEVCGGGSDEEGVESELVWDDAPDVALAVVGTLVVVVMSLVPWERQLLSVDCPTV
jgi:hypothetical protein